MKRYIYGKNIAFLIAIIFIGASIIPTLSGSSGGAIQDNGNIRIAIQSNNDITTINYQISEFTSEEVNIDGDSYFRIALGEESNIMVKGKPELPNICRSIIIPDDLRMKVRITQSQYTEYEGIQIIPSKGNLPRSVNPEEVPYEFDEMYNENKWFPDKIADLREPYIVRDFRGLVVEINPFQYNPVENKLRFFTDISVEIYPDGEDTVNIINREELPNNIDIDYNHIYERHFLNYENIGRYTPVEEQGNMLVITYDSFWDTMVPYIQWKNMKGIAIEMVNVSTIGDEYAIDTYIEDYYEDYGLTFVLLVGDAAQVPTLNIGSSASDPSYSYIVGEDHYPDIFVGRFSAQNVGQLETQVERSIEYEKYPQVDADWYQKGTGIASSQGPGDDNEMDYEHIRNIRFKLMNYTYTDVDELYDGSQGGEDESGNPTPSMVSASINDGRSIANYCGHGSPTSWGTSGFSTTDINNLVNDNMLPYVTCVACNNGQFDDYDASFCEAWLRATHDGEPAGAIVATGSSVSMSWNPPMDAQDEMNDLVVESYTDNVKHTFGGIHVNGCMHMNDEYGSSGESETDYWHIFGDPSIQIRTDTPSEMSVIHDSLIPIGATSYEVEVEGLEDALCAISYNYELIGCGYTDETGIAIINFDEMQFYEGGIELVVTGYNKIPYNTTIQVGSSYPPDPPTVAGPEAGKPEKEYEFTAITTDPEDDQILYMFDWGDGTFTDWLGPFFSGQIVTVSHSWSELGQYEIKVKAKDVEQASSKWSDPYQVKIELPEIDIGTIKGGLFKITAAIENPGIVEAEEINWKIALDGGFIFLGRETTGSINTILAGEEENVTSKPIFGFGPTQVVVTVDIPEGSYERDQGAYVLLFFITVNPGGQ